jgi:hypothetical protein
MFHRERNFLEVLRNGFEIVEGDNHTRRVVAATLRVPAELIRPLIVSDGGW